MTDRTPDVDCPTCAFRLTSERLQSPTAADWLALRCRACRHPPTDYRALRDVTQPVPPLPPTDRAS